MEFSRDSARQMLGAMREQKREEFRKGKETWTFRGTRVKLPIEEETAEVMVYKPSVTPAPVYFDIHGGGFVWGETDDGELYNRRLADELGFVVVALSYPRVPDCEYPAQAEYVYEEILYLRDHAAEFGIDPAEMAIGGRSAGANLAAAVCLMAKERGTLSFVMQVLDHPWLDLGQTIPADKRYQGEYALPTELMKLLALGYAQPSRWKEPFCSPICASAEQMRGLPPAIIRTCEYDSLAAEGECYAAALRAAGVYTVYHCFPKAVHGFSESDTELGEAGRDWLLREIGKLRHIFLTEGSEKA